MPAEVLAPLRPGSRYALQGVLGESSGGVALRYSEESPRQFAYSLVTQTPGTPCVSTAQATGLGASNKHPSDPESSPWVSV